MEEQIKDKPAEEKPGPSLKPGAQGITITPVDSHSPKPTTPLPKVSQPMPPFPPMPGLVIKQKKDILTLLLLIAVIFNIFSLWIYISIGLDKIPRFLIKFF